MTTTDPTPLSWTHKLEVIKALMHAGSVRLYIRRSVRDLLIYLASIAGETHTTPALTKAQIYEDISISEPELNATLRWLISQGAITISRADKPDAPFRAITGDIAYTITLQEIPTHWQDRPTNWTPAERIRAMRTRSAKELAYRAREKDHLRLARQQRGPLIDPVPVPEPVEAEESRRRKAAPQETAESQPPTPELPAIPGLTELEDTWIEANTERTGFPARRFNARIAFSSWFEDRLKEGVRVDELSSLAIECLEHCQSIQTGHDTLVRRWLDAEWARRNPALPESKQAWDQIPELIEEIISHVGWGETERAQAKAIAALEETIPAAAIYGLTQGVGGDELERRFRSRMSEMGVDLTVAV